METKKKKKDLPAPLHSGKTLSSKQIDLLFWKFGSHPNTPKVEKPRPKFTANMAVKKSKYMNDK